MCSGLLAKLKEICLLNLFPLYVKRPVHVLQTCLQLLENNLLLSHQIIWSLSSSSGRKERRGKGLKGMLIMFRVYFLFFFCTLYLSHN